MAEVVSIHIVRKKKAPAESCDHVTIRTNFGIEGDYRSGKYQTGQITLIESEVMDTASRKLGYEIPAGASRRQIVVRGVSLNETIGHKLRLGSVLVLVEEKCKPCDNMEAAIGPGAKDAMNGRGGVRCRVIKGGELHASDAVTIEDSVWPYYARLTRLCFKIINYLIKLSNKA
jgi:MOSC domain-containing protein YiiM